MEEITINVILRCVPGSRGWVATSPELQELREEAESPAELIARIQHYVAPDLLRTRGIIDPNARQKLTLLTRFEE